MKNIRNLMQSLISKADEDDGFRERLIGDPKRVIESEFGIRLTEGIEIHVHSESDTTTHLVLPPKSKFSEEERAAARTGAASLEFLKKTMYDPAPPKRTPARTGSAIRADSLSPGELANMARQSIGRGLEFLETTIDERGAWHCIRYNLADANIPRHYERPAFVSALCVLALESSNEPRAKSICARSKAYIVDTMEHPGLWRYYRHLPPDLDSTALCSLVIGSHPWILVERNLPAILENRDENGCFTTWILAEGEPEVVPTFRIEADPVVNANVIAYLGDREETNSAQRWIEKLVVERQLADSSKWYPDEVSLYYAVSRAMAHAPPALFGVQPILEVCIRTLGFDRDQMGNILQTAQAVSALYNIGSLTPADAERHIAGFISAQADDGSWPELLVYGDQFLKWGVLGEIGHASESITTAFCIEALERLYEVLSSGEHGSGKVI